MKKHIGFNDPKTYNALFKMAQLAYSSLGRGAINLSIEDIKEKDSLSTENFIKFLKRNCYYLPIDFNHSSHLTTEQIEVAKAFGIIELYKKEAESYNPRTEFVLMLHCPAIPEINKGESISLITCTRFGKKYNN